MATLGGFARLGTLALIVALAPTAHAAGGRPMTTDDADLTNARSCQIETWLQHSRGDAQLWLLPACNPGRFEVSAGTVLDWPQGSAHRDAYVLQGKLQWLDAHASGGAFTHAGLAFGAQRATDPALWTLLYAYVPVSFALSTATQLHANLGWQRDRIARDDQLTYAIALGHDLSPRFNVFGELFGADNAAPTAQTGGAMLFRQGTVQLDGSIGRPLRGSLRDYVFSIGLELYPNALW